MTGVPGTGVRDRLLSLFAGGIAPGRAARRFAVFVSHAFSVGCAGIRIAGTQALGVGC